MAMNKPQPRNPDRDEHRWLLAIVLVGLALRVASIIALDFLPESDYLTYQTMALNLLNGRGLTDPWGDRAIYNVGYPLFVLTPVFALFGNSLLAVQLVNAALGTLCIIACYAIAQEAGAGRTGRLLAAALWALYLPSLVYAEYLAKENLMTPLMLGVTWCTLRLMKEVSIGLGVRSGVLFGLLALTGNAGLVLVPAAVIALLLARASVGLKLASSLVALIVALAVAAPWMIRNMHALGSPVLNTNGGFNLYLGNNPAATGYFVSIADTPRGPTWAALRREGEIQASATLRREAMAWIREEPRQFVSLALRKAMLFWRPPVHEGKGPGSTMETLLRRIWLLQFVVVAAAAIGSAFVPVGRTRYVGMLWLSIASYTAVHMLFYVIFRYREPIMPLLCVLAALTLESFWVRWGHVGPRLEGTRRPRAMRVRRVAWASHARWLSRRTSLRSACHGFPDRPLRA
jgi:4-amino-4-deoxy-L-arabinose transferase-like glycosyltransferase